MDHNNTTVDKDDPKPTPNELKYFCKVCSKGFGCGRALGGHMRSHGIGGDGERNGAVFDDDDDDDDDPAGDDWDDGDMGADHYNVQPENRRMYALRTNPNRMKSCRVCRNCGEEFVSSKLFLEHGTCTSDGVAQSSEGEEGVERRPGAGWSKRKRSFRVKVDDNECNTNCLSNEEEDLATCLMMLSKAKTTSTRFGDEPDESCASAVREDRHERGNTSSYLPLITYETQFDRAKGAGRGLFECKACKKVFTSHQALGGHRASHKKVKGCFASRLDDHDENPEQNVNQNATQVVLGHDQEDITPPEHFLMPQAKSKSALQFEHKFRTQVMLSKKKSKGHECSICHRVFQSGQALGGHKRCHWITSNALHDTSTSTGMFPHYHQEHQIEHNTSQIPTLLTESEQLDLNNLPTTTTTTFNELGKVSPDPQNPSRFEVSTEIVLYDTKEHLEQHTSNNNDANKSIVINDGDDALVHTRDNVLEAKVELPKLSELKDTSRDSSPWLQVGIGSTNIDLGGNT